MKSSKGYFMKGSLKSDKIKMQVLSLLTGQIF